MNVVITGATSGLGLNLAKEFCKKKHNVILAGRNVVKMKNLQRFITNESQLKNCHLFECDVQDPRQVESLGHFASIVYDKEIDHWINNAAICEGPQNFTEVSMDDIRDVFSTNLLGTVYGVKVASIHNTKNIYIVNGHGSNGQSTPLFGLYGSSKAALSQLYSSLVAEDDIWKRVKILKPGMMKTNLSKKLLESDKYNTVQKFFFNIITMDPNDIAKSIVDEITK